MRTVADRIRHAISFELLGLALIIPIGSWAFSMPVTDIGIVGVVSATLATAWNYIYNLGFDHVLQRYTGTTLKTVGMRVAHAALFEAGLLMILMPFIAWYLGISLWHAFVMDVAFALFYMVYAFAFNWAYDRLFPLPEWQDAQEAGKV
ncbi:PACE efflux transporter [Rhizobium sp. WL3]|uniref:PACE efflux transporter n=1 Tax=Rhizobium sp. WL3 TaxID=2603277 RepID=UPI0011C1E512|nr:PACE efflux transporter [Rhizobium sp. WL3]QEE44798.1 PACE efflux transporter [Rhizobium sp. WL3]